MCILLGTYVRFSDILHNYFFGLVPFHYLFTYTFCMKINLKIPIVHYFRYLVKMKVVYYINITFKLFVDVCSWHLLVRKHPKENFLHFCLYIQYIDYVVYYQPTYSIGFMVKLRLKRQKYCWSEMHPKRGWEILCFYFCCKNFSVIAVGWTGSK